MNLKTEKIGSTTTDGEPNDKYFTTPEPSCPNPRFMTTRLVTVGLRSVDLTRKN